jgi:hypothetical protein
MFLVELYFSWKAAYRRGDAGDECCMHHLQGVGPAYYEHRSSLVGTGKTVQPDVTPR